MSDDIVTRLLICAKYDPDQKEAAEEITRLRAELAAAKERIEDAEEALTIAYMQGVADSKAERDELRAELAAAKAREQEAAKALQEHVFRAFQEGFNSSLSYIGAYDMADAWEMSDARARIDTFLKGDGDE